jgi:hypothetical protein
VLTSSPQSSSVKPGASTREVLVSCQQSAISFSFQPGGVRRIERTDFPPPVAKLMADR